MTRHQFVDPPQTWTACVAPHAKDPERQRQASVGFLCAGHHAGLEQLLAELPWLLGEVEENLPRGSSQGPKVTGTPSHPLPFTEAVSEALGAAQALLASWCLLVLEEHPDRLHAPPSTATLMSAFLLRHLDWCCAQPWVDDLLRELRDLQSGLRRTLSPARTRTVPLGPCEEPLACDLTSHDLLCCAGTLTAVVHVLEDTLPGAITCAECGTRHEPETWRHLARRLRRGEESWLTAAQLSQLLRVPLKTLQRWALEDQWRFTETRPRRYQHEDAQASYDAHRLEESA